MKIATIVMSIVLAGIFANAQGAATTTETAPAAKTDAPAAGKMEKTTETKDTAKMDKKGKKHSKHSKKEKTEKTEETAH